jgi:hypothetical protein
MLVGAGL